jgi:hypothetical protein
MRIYYKSRKGFSLKELGCQVFILILGSLSILIYIVSVETIKINYTIG